ncbi:MAG: phage late control D family protein [Cyanobacteria bacterium CRU_2_1]|nr:phage late control D family protein [Cyanobacteria bacterium RU_5_0]NJR57844.1 phage late control D family protein [Cyanobacteria bacterium CRU_2_1]
MLSKPTSLPRLAEFDIRIDDLPLLDSEEFQVIRITVDDTVDMPSMFSIEFANLGGLEVGKSLEASIEIIDNSQFNVGRTVEIRLGYLGQLTPVIRGEITSLEAEFTCDRPMNLLVRGYDHRHRLQRGRKTQTFTQVKDSDIARRITVAAGLGHTESGRDTIEDTEVVHEYVMQVNQTDMEFLQERAALIHYEVIVKDKVLFFRPIGNANRVRSSLTFQEDLVEFYPRLSAKEQVSSVTVRSWNPQMKEMVAYTARSSDAVSKMGGDQTGAEVSTSAFGNTVEVISDRRVETQSEAKQIAIAQFNDAILGFITSEGVCRGRPDLLANTVVHIDGLGDRFSGEYYVVSASHRYEQIGYYTHFTVRRNAS